MRYTITDRAPRYHHREVPWGTQYAGYRPAGPDSTYYRVGNFLFPFWTQAPNGEFSSHMHARGWVPLDDTHTMYVFIWWKKAVAAMSLPQPAYKDGRPIEMEVAKFTVWAACASPVRVTVKVTMPPSAAEPPSQLVLPVFVREGATEPRPALSTPPGAPRLQQPRSPR